jgi:hypothetical protein
MSKFTPAQLVNVFSQLGLQMLSPDEEFLSIIDSQQHHNPWFTPESVLRAVKAIGGMLNQVDLTRWIDAYQINKANPKRTGLILAGNIPLVGFHDVFCVLASGNFALIKASSQDSKLIRHVLKMLADIEPAFAQSFEFVERLENFDAIIATGSNNTSRYFEYYFGKVPHIIRKNRSSVALLAGNETNEQLYALGHDIFDYYGLGCRNVAKLLVPEGYSFNPFFEAIEEYKPVGNHHKYANNYDYNKTIFLVNSNKHLDNGFLLLKEDTKLASPLAVLYFEYYESLSSAETKLEGLSEQIQCVVTNASIPLKAQIVGFGESQQPKLWDYADGIDTMAFMTGLN